MRALARSLRRYARPYRRALVLGVVLAIVEVAAGLALPWPLKVIVDQVVGPQPVGNRELLLAACVLALVAIVGIGALADYWSTRLLASAGLWLGNDLRADVFTHLHRLSLGFHGRHQVGDLTARVTSDVDRTQDLLVQSLAVLGPNLLLVGGMFSVMVVVQPALTLVALVASPLTVLAVVRSTRALKQTSRSARRAEGQVASAAAESLTAIPVIQAFALEPQQRRRFALLSEASLRHGLEAVRLQARFSPFVDLTSALSTAIVLWFGVRQVLAGELTLGVLLVFLSYLGSLYKPVKAIARLASTLGKGMAASERVAEVLAEEPDVAEAPGAVAAPRFRGEIRLSGVGFSYGREPVLRNLDLGVGAGETVALVGRTGAGKSTVAALVARLIDPDEGAVLIDGIDVQEMTLASLRRQVSFVLQDTMLLRGTLRENIAWGRPGAPDRDVRRAAKLALVDEFAARLPQGLDTPLGERGVNLSGGQRQRVAIARAILRDAPILVLDEPTSALDAQSEQELVAALDQLPAGRTTLVIAHRLSTVRRAERICVLADGSLVEEGAHAELLELGGAYAAMTGHSSRSLVELAR